MQSVPGVPVGGSRLGSALTRQQCFLLVPDLRILDSPFRVWTYPLLPSTVTWVLSSSHPGNGGSTPIALPQKARANFTSPSPGLKTVVCIPASAAACFIPMFSLQRSMVQLSWMVHTSVVWTSLCGNEGIVCLPGRLEPLVLRFWANLTGAPSPSKCKSCRQTCSGGSLPPVLSVSIAASQPACSVMPCVCNFVGACNCQQPKFRWDQVNSDHWPLSSSAMLASISVQAFIAPGCLHPGSANGRWQGVVTILSWMGAQPVIVPCMCHAFVVPMTGAYVMPCADAPSLAH